ncbi:MAG: DUF1731 domain-containing protein [Candidatus Calescibacterium sp.]|nr:DUF1731 domain-containing protein [Candidatus Calescibacterium sp.]MDW8087679.1 DUF1731 domain-containing protein [Candidatus Calescibacterium sp.]
MIILAGGTGLIGTNLLRSLGDKDVIVITRNKKSAKAKLGGMKNILFLEWNEIFEEKWIEKLRVESERIVVNLAGENIGRVWTKTAKKEIMESRLNSTRTAVRLAERIEAQKLINASATGFYGDTGDEEKNEKASAGNSFLSNVCYMWEDEAKKVKKSKLFILRIGIVLDRKAKIVSSSITPLFIVNPFGRGENYISWIHIKDLSKIIRSIIDGKFETNGKFPEERKRKPVEDSAVIINCVSPNPVKTKDFIRTIAEIKKRKIVNIPQIFFEILFGKDFVQETLRVSQRIRPSFLIENGFEFDFPDIRTALKDILG